VAGANLARVILEKPEVWGVQTLYTDAVLLRVVARTVPLRQWEVQRELTERLKNSLDANGADGSGVMPGPNGAGNGDGAHGDPAGPGDQRPLAAPPSPTTTTTLLVDVPTPRESGGAPSGPADPGT